MSSIPRYYCPHPETGIFEEGEAHHCRNVLRQRVGEAVTVFDGRGCRWDARLVRVAKNEVAFEQISAPRMAPAPSVELSLAQAIAKPRAMDWILTKAVELGVAIVAPLVTQRTVAEPPAERAAARHAKWQQLLVEAAKQSGQDRLPELLPAQSLEAFLARPAAANSIRLVGALEADARPLREALAGSRTARRVSHVTWMVGPEGDFASQELAAAKSAGFVPVSLGPLVLRCETAAVFGLVAAQYEFQT